MPNWNQQLTNMQERENMDRLALRMPFGMVVQSVAAESESVKVSYYSNKDRYLPISHPFVSPHAWIRAMPENNALMLGIFRTDEQHPHPVSFYGRQTEQKISAFKTGEGRTNYRTLLPGELELSSSGFGQSYYARRAKIDHRAGILFSSLDQDELKAFAKAPLHSREMMQKKYDNMLDEERLGIVVRQKNTWERYFPKINDNYASEHYLEMENLAGSAPKTLLTTHRGQVFDETGNRTTQNITGIPLRLYDRFYANDDSVTMTQIDEKGNYYSRLADAASEGYQLDVPAGFFNMIIAMDELVTIAENREHTVGKSARYYIGDNLSWTANKTIFVKSELGGSSLVFDSTADKQKVYLTTINHMMAFDDTKDKEAIYFVHKTGTQMAFDQEGSIKQATFGGNLVYLNEKDGSVNIIAKNKANIKVSKDITIVDGSGKQFITLDGTGKISIVADSDVTLNAQRVNVNGGSISLGANASFSAVIGENLATLFDAHIHPTAVGPSGPPTPPNTAKLFNLNPATSFLSKFVKIRSNIA